MYTSVTDTLTMLARRGEDDTPMRAMLADVFAVDETPLHTAVG